MGSASAVLGALQHEMQNPHEFLGAALRNLKTLGKARSDHGLSVCEQLVTYLPDSHPLQRSSRI